MLTGKTIGQLTYLETPTADTLLPVELSGFTYHIDFSSITSNNGGGVVETTYSELQDMVNGGGLVAGTFYTITDFRTCYDQPDYDESGNPITVGIYKQATINPIIVFATSSNTLSTNAYQPSYPKDKIQYDVYFNQTEITGGDAYGRITERIDEYNNRTDYDHRNIVFKRYTTYFYDMGNPRLGTIEILDNTGSITGTNTNFTELNVGDVIKIKDGSNYKVVNVVSDTEMYVTGKTINTGSNLTYYLTNTELDNDNSGYQKSYDFIDNNIIDTEVRELPTFRFEWELDNNGEVKSVNNYIGNHSNFWYTNLSHSFFLLANNTFSLYSYSNTLGDRCYNNSSYTWFNRNKISGSFYNNSMWKGFYSNIIGEYCNNNIFGGYTWRNKLGEDFNNNRTFDDFQNNIINNGFNSNIILDEFYKNDIGNGFNNNLIFSEFYGNEIGNAFNDNNIYSEFYDNQIGEYFEDNNIGDIGNNDNFNFYRNRIGNNFDDNDIRQDFQNNQIGNQFYNNTVNGTFYKNVIGNGFNNNDNIGYDFYGNHIGNGFYSNDLIGDYFQNNQIGEYFQNNNISNYFQNNQIGNQFEYNTLGDYQYYGWSNTSFENLTGRTYNTFYNALYGDNGQNIGNIILSKELIMHDTVNDEYHKVKFTQWTQGGGGGFSYERTKVYPTVESTVYFTKTNYGSEVDVIVEGSLEITRGENGGIYNSATEGFWNGNNPDGTEWNSIYTQQNNNTGEYFQDNIIGNQFKGNLILNQFYLNQIDSIVGYNQFTGDTVSNKIGPFTFSNDFYGYVIGNSWKGDFYSNSFGNNFANNNFESTVSNNNIGEYFQYNNIGSYFYNNTIGNDFGYGYGSIQGNRIGSNFYDNIVGEYFYNNTIPDNFYNNTIGNYFQWNIVDTWINGVDFTYYYGNVTAFTFSALGTTASDNTYNGLIGTTNGDGVDATFDIEVSGGSVIGITGNTQGKLYNVSDTITILGSQINGTDGVDDVVITVTGISPNPSVYELYTCNIFKNANLTNRLSYYDVSDVLTIKNINE
jgi:hypothetical protein